MYNYIRLAEIISLENVGELGRVRVQFQDPNASNIEEGVLIYLTGDNACPAVGDQCVVLGIGDNYGINYVFPYDIDNAPKILGGEKIIYTKDSKIYLKNDGTITIETTGKVNVISPEGNFSEDVNLGGVLKVNNIKVVGSQGATVVDPIGGAIIDVEARTAIITLKARLQAHGLIA